MPLIAQAEAERRLQPFLSAMFRIPRNAWDIYHRLTPAALLVHYKASSRAYSVHDLMVAEAAKVVAVNELVQPFESRGMRGILIDGMAVRFKKLDEQGQSRPSITAQVEDFRNQLPLPGIDALHNIELGYVLNDDETDIVEIRVSCPNGKKVFGSMRLTDEGGEMVVADLFDPIAPAVDGDDDSAAVKPKTPPGVVLPFHKKTDNET